MGITRRTFVGSIVSAAVVRMVHGQSASAGSLEWGAPVIDCHFHQRQTMEACLAHLDGSGCQAAYLLSRVQSADDAQRFMANEPKRIAGYSVSTDITVADAVKILTEAVKAGAHGIGEVKSHVEADGPEMRRLYAAAAELKVPITIHFQEVPHTPTEGVFNAGFKRFDRILKEFSKTTFIGHCDAFWANVSADYADDRDYPRTSIVAGGITDRWLGDYPNLFGDMSANSGNNALTRDPSFTADFLKRHSKKLFFGSDCSCSDGRGGGISQNNNPGASRLAGKCVARETLTVLKANTTPALFHDLVWTNGHHIYGMRAL